MANEKQQLIDGGFEPATRKRRKQRVVRSKCDLAIEYVGGLAPDALTEFAKTLVERFPSSAEYLHTKMQCTLMRHERQGLVGRVEPHPTVEQRDVPMPARLNGGD